MGKAFALESVSLVLEKAGLASPGKDFCCVPLVLEKAGLASLGKDFCFVPWSWKRLAWLVLEKTLAAGKTGLAGLGKGLVVGKWQHSQHQRPHRRH